MLGLANPNPNSDPNTGDPNIDVITQHQNTPLKPMRCTITQDIALDCPIITNRNKRKEKKTSQ